MTTNKETAVPGIDSLDEPEREVPESGARPALNVLSVLRRGQVMDLLSEELNRVVTGIKDSNEGKGGHVTLTLKILPVKQHTNAVHITATVVGKAPEDPPSSDLLFYGEDGNLYTRDPNQGDMFHIGGES